MTDDFKVMFTAAPGFIMWPNGIMQLETTMPSCALYTLAAVVERAGFPCTIVDPVEYWRSCRNLSAFQALVSKHRVVCISANSITWFTALPLIQHIAQAVPRPIIVAGGLHPTYCDENVLETSEVDVVVRGEGEVVIRELLRAIASGSPLDDIHGLAFKRDGRIIRTPDRHPLSAEEISETPLPYWDRLPPLTYSFIPIEMSRGCKFGCTFCGIYHRRLWRTASDSCIRRRIEDAARHLPWVRQRAFMFTDDCFTGSIDKLRVVESALRDFAPDVGIGIEARAPDVLNTETLSVLKNLNIEFIQIGVECGYDEGLRKIKKGITIEQVIASTHAMHSIGLDDRVKYSFIVGFPWETPDDVMRTINFALGLGSRYRNKIQINWLLITPGSEIFEQFQREKLVSYDDYNTIPPNVPGLFMRSHPSIAEADAMMIHDYAIFVQQSFPWVGALGNLFRLWNRHAHVPFDRTTPVKKDSAFDSSNPARLNVDFLREYLPPVFHSTELGG
jgi:radical SAM superfamily enzyme YgiQ (UPF0313 family)